MLHARDTVYALIRNFGPDWYSNNLEEPFRAMVRQAVRKRGINETAISTTALDDIDNEIRDQLRLFIKEKALPVELVTMTVGNGWAGCILRPCAPASLPTAVIVGALLFALAVQHYFRRSAFYFCVRLP